MAGLFSFVEKYIVVLLGPSGSGKTTYGQLQLEYEDYFGDEVMFLSTGLELRKQNVMSVWQEADMIVIKDFCHKLINETFANFKKSETHKLLILDCVKDLEDAEYIAAEAKKHDLRITRALLFENIGPKELGINWIRREEARDIFRGSVHAYLRNWNIKSNDLINFYKKSNILYRLYTLSAKTHVVFGFYPGLLPILEEPYSKDSLFCAKDIQVLPSLNNLSVLLTSSVKIKDIFAELLSILKVNEIQFTLPASFVHCHRDVMWVTNPAKYHVTAKADGVRCLLMKIQGGTYLITRKNEIYPCCIANDKLPNNTVLDGELLPSTSISEIHPKISTFLNSSVFLVFDVLAISGDVLWKWPFTVRQVSLCKLPISKDIAAVMKQASRGDKSSANQKLQSFHVEENSLNELVVHCVLKEHKPSTPVEVLKFLGAMHQLPCPCDGLIFTPNTAYEFGPDPLLFKWQSEDSAHCDILVEDLKSGKRKCAVDLASDFRSPSKQKSNKTITHFPNSLNEREVMECQWNKSHEAWDPLFVRQDKSAPNSDETIDHVENMCQQPYTEEHLIVDLTEINGTFNKLKDATNTTTPSVNHPLAGYSFDELYTKITELVNLGYVEKTVDSATNLEIFNYSTSVISPLVSLCRGLVLHPDSKTIVTKPFIRFFEDVDEGDPNEIVEATIKYDGSLGIAFLWDKEVKVTTRRRMDSEQALWAKQWIKDHCNLTKFQTGYTYLFEIISQNNTVIVKYLFEGLILLAIIDESGHELPYDDMLHCARTIGFFMVTPRITAPYSEILWYCAGIDFTLQQSTTPSCPPLDSGALPVNKRQEGWVVKFKDGRRQKMVYSWWKEVSQIAHLVHPQIVWLLLRLDRRNILGNVPNHLRVEINRMIRALGRKFIETIKHVEEHLIVLHMKSQNVPAKLNREKMYGVWDDSLYLRVSNQFEDSEDSTSDEGSSFKLREQSEKLCLDDNDVMMSNSTTRQDDEEHIEEAEEGSVTITSDFVKLARELNLYFKVTEFPSSFNDVNFSPVYSQVNENFLRLPVLDYICPTSPALDGYEPSDNFKQTWCKGWKTLPINQMQFIQEVLQRNHSHPPFLQLPVEVIVLVLDFLDGQSLAIMSQVCLQLQHIVKSSHVLKKRISTAKEKHIQLDMTPMWGDVEDDHHVSWYVSGYSSADSSEGCWGSYGSF